MRTFLTGRCAALGLLRHGGRRRTVPGGGAPGRPQRAWPLRGDDRRRRRPLDDGGRARLPAPGPSARGRRGRAAHARCARPLSTLPDELNASLFSVDLIGGPEYWFGFDNFYALLQYNRSRNYVMAIYELSIEITREKERLAVSGEAPEGR